MSFYDDDYREEAYLDELYQEFSTEGIEKFQAERLCSFYLANPLIAKEPFDFLGEATKLLPIHASAAQLVAMSSIEVGIKLAFVKPIVYGLVHIESVANLVTEIVMKHTRFDNFQDLVLGILADRIAVDLKTYVRSGATKTFWKEIKDAQDVRNKILHHAILCDKEDAKRTIAVASVLWEEFFPTFVRNLGLHLHEGMKFCADEPCYDDTPVMFPNNSAVVLAGDIAKKVRKTIKELKEGGGPTSTT